MKKELIRMIVSDIDGTMLHSDGTMSEYTVQVIHRAQEKGILFTVCSGRFPEHAHALLKNYGIFCPVCGNNGVTLWDARSNTVLKDHLISPEAVRAIWSSACEMRLSCIIFGRGFVASSDETAYRMAQGRFTDVLKREYGIAYTVGREAVEKALKMPVNKFYFYHLAESEKAVFISIPGITVTSSGHQNAEIIPAGCNKAGGVVEMAGSYGVDLKHVMTIGDYENDLPMLTSVGLGVAMGNASEAVKAKVRYVTDTNDRDGMAKAIERFVL